MKVYPSRDFIFFCCGSCVSCFLWVALWFYFNGWRYPALSPIAPTQGPVLGERTKMRLPKVVRHDEATVDLNAYLVDRNAFYQALPAQHVQKNPLEDQAKLLEAYEKAPEKFLDRYKMADRLFLF